MVNVLFFARLKEQLGCEQLTLEITAETCTINEVKNQLLALHPEWASHFNNTSLLMAINQEMVNAQALVKSGDEVAFFPPVTGG